MLDTNHVLSWLTFLQPLQFSTEEKRVLSSVQTRLGQAQAYSILNESTALGWTFPWVVSFIQQQLAQR